MSRIEIDRSEIPNALPPAQPDLVCAIQSAIDRFTDFIKIWQINDEPLHPISNCTTRSHDIFTIY